MSGCLNHPGVEAVARCKTCTKPVCSACVVKGPTGSFCSGECKEKHENFVRRAQDQNTRSRSGLFAKVRGLVASLIIVILVAFVIGTIATIIYIPVLSELTGRVRTIIGI